MREVIPYQIIFFLFSYLVILSFRFSFCILIFDFFIMVLNIISPSKLIYQGEVSSVTVPGAKGEFTVLPNHASLVSSLKQGEIKVVPSSQKNQEKFSIDIERGVLEVSESEVSIILTEFSTSNPKQEKS